MTFPFSAVLGAEQMQLALVLTAVSPDIGGVLVRGEKGTAKSTAVRALAALLPPIEVVDGCRFGCNPAAPDTECPDGPHPHGAPASMRRPRLVELPVGASEDRVVGSLDLERALAEGARAFEPGLLAGAHRGVLYVDEVNLLPDHLVDVLLDAAAMGRNHVERDAVSVRHAARFVLIGSMNPEEGDLRPQLLDRFGLAVDVAASRDPKVRVEVVRRRLAADADPAAFAARWADDERRLAGRISAARARVDSVALPDAALRQIAEICAAFDVDGMRADIVTARTAVAHAAWHDRDEVTTDDVRAAALLALPHRRRRTPFDEPGADQQRLDDILQDTDPDDGPDDADPHDPDGGGPDDPGDGPDRGPGSAPDDAAGGSSTDRSAPPRPPTAQPDQSPPNGVPHEQTAPVGTASPTRTLTGKGRGPAARGRRAAARTGTGRTVGVLPSGSDAGPLHLTATVWAAAAQQHRRGRTTGPLQLAPSDLRRADRRGREGNLVLFVVDASGSMAARARMSQVKAAVLGLLTDAYQRRDRVGLITFRAAGAELALPPTRSVEFAARRLAAIATGGRTPLAAGLLRAATVIAAEQLRDPLRRPLVLLLTDGRADTTAATAAAAPLRAHDVVVVDCESGPVRLGLARRLAIDLGAGYLTLPELTERSAA
ncbi:MAG: VWA domain-containing protein [Jatrophihabitans sp.]|uniref:VWA domain-containing protein n=1 Tax=Jatrophihabitans sp. TaxID=1932789 RepID=UPI003F7CE191